MKQHTQRFKESITELGKQQSVLITYTIDNEEVVLGVEEINSATPRYDADLLKSVMKELHLDSNVDIPVGTEINFKYGLLVDGAFEYLDYGNYIVYTSEKKEDTASYEILCYDKMLYAMKEYEELNITYPCTVIQYINAIANKMGLKVSSNNNKFPNYNTEIAGEFYLSIDEETKERTSLGYTYRDILDDLAEVTASVICINEYDELEVRDIKDAINYETTEKSKELKIESQLEEPIQLVTLDGASVQNGTPIPEAPVEIQSVGDDGTVEIKQVGKNLLDLKKKPYNETSSTLNGAIVTIENGILTVDATNATDKITLKSNWATYTSVTTIVLPKGTYYTNLKLNLTDSETLNSKQTSAGKFTIDTDHYLTQWFITPPLGEISSYALQIEQGEKATQYEEYKEISYVIPTTPLRSLPNGVKDTIEADGTHRRVEEIVFDGSENWSQYASQTLENTSYFCCTTGLTFSSERNLYCSHFTFNYIWGADIVGIYLDTKATDGIRIRIPTTIASTVEELKTWLSTHNVEVLYELAEEVIEPFDEEQQAVIDSMETFEGVNIISSNAELQIRYAIDQDTIDEEYLKDTNVNFGEVFGPVNAVVLSRSSSDNIYRNDIASINANGLYEIKISDNQIMNQNNRDTFIQAIFDKLKGLTYGICDFSSTGIMYYDLLDRFNVKVGDNTYSIVMFHDEQNITQGLEENIFAEKPERSETDYTKADKTDIKLNQTNLIVDKQNGTIEALVTSNSDLVQKTAQLIIDIEGIKGQISDVADVTTTAEGYGTAELDNISGDSEPIYLKVYPTNEDIISLKPSTTLYPRIDLYPHSREVYFKNTSSQEPYEVVFDIPTDLYQLNGVYDECILSYEAKECYVIHRIGINEDGEKYLLETEEIERFDEYPKLPLTEGNYQVYIPAFNMAYIYVRLMSKNIYTEQFATKVELKSTVEQTANSITTSVNQMLTNYDTKTEVNSKIAQTATDITSTVSETYETKSNANSKYSEIKQTTDSISSTVSKKVGNDEVISKINQSAEQVQINANKISLARKNS